MQREAADRMAGVQAVVLASGPGTRMRPFTLRRPKTLLPVCNVPILARLLVQLEAAGFRRVTVGLSAVADEIWDRAQSLFPPHLEIDRGRSASLALGRPRRGSVGGVRQCLEPGAERILVIYGDSLIQADFAALLEAHAAARRRQGAATVLYHRPADLRIPEKEGRTYHGVLSVNEDGLITRFVEKPKVEEIKPGFDLANAAVFVIERSWLDAKESADARDFSYDFFERALRDNLCPIYGCDIGRGFRHDAGNVDRFLEANLKVLRGLWLAAVPGRQAAPGIWQQDEGPLDGVTLTAPVLLGRGVRLGAGAVVGPDVVIGDGCVVGEGAQIRRSVLLEECVISRACSLEGSVLGGHVRLGNHVHLPAGSALGDFSAVADAG
jgi:mannose-1-phosphate guanylyltransferase/phosphomannomutase